MFFFLRLADLLGDLCFHYIYSWIPEMERTSTNGPMVDTESPDYSRLRVLFILSVLLFCFLLELWLYFHTNSESPLFVQGLLMKCSYLVNSGTVDDCPLSLLNKRINKIKINNFGQFTPCGIHTGQIHVASDINLFFFLFCPKYQGLHLMLQFLKTRHFCHWHYCKFKMWI